jgi:hypothetical protein
LKRGHIILIGGAVLLVTGIAIAAVWGVSFASSFVANNTIIVGTPIQPSRSVEARTDVNTLDRPLSLAIRIERQQQSPLDNIRLKETISDPNGKIVSSSEFQESFFTTIKPTATGTYTVTVSNFGTKPVTISGTFGYMPFVTAEGKPNLDEMTPVGGLSMIIVGGGLAAAGIVTLIVGGIITVLDGRKTQGTATTSEGGITYRKD